MAIPKLSLRKIKLGRQAEQSAIERKERQRRTATYHKCKCGNVAGLDNQGNPRDRCGRCQMNWEARNSEIEREEFIDKLREEYEGGSQ